MKKLLALLVAGVALVACSNNENSTSNAASAPAVASAPVAPEASAPVAAPSAAPEEASAPVAASAAH